MESNPPHSTLAAVAVSIANPSARGNRVYSPMKECWSRDDLFTCSERHHSAAAAHWLHQQYAQNTAEGTQRWRQHQQRSAHHSSFFSTATAAVHHCTSPSPFCFAVFTMFSAFFKKEKQTEWNERSKLNWSMPYAHSHQTNQSNYIWKTVKLIKITNIALPH